MKDIDTIWQTHTGSIHGLREKRPTFRFDPAFYASQRPDLSMSPAGLAAHYAQVGDEEGLFPTLYRRVRAAEPEIDTVLAKLVIEPDLAAAIQANQPDACELAFELIHLGAPLDEVVSHFSMARYLATHPDIARAGIDPLSHYVMHGAKEGRRTLADLRKSHRHGMRDYHPGRPTCLIAVHECSRTGAPQVGLDMAREACETHNVIVASLRDGPMLDDFLDHACEVVITGLPTAELPCFAGDIFKRIDFAIINSVETWVFVPHLVANDIPFAAYIHEYADYTFPSYKSTFAALFTDLLVFSSDHVRDSWSGRLKDIEFDTGKDTAIVPQRNFHIGTVDSQAQMKARARLSQLLGRDLSNVRLICGAGHLQWRKGTDIFAMTAHICRQQDPDTVFLWIGDGLNAEDPHFGAYMTYQLRQTGAADQDTNLLFLPAGPAYLDVLTASDAMFMSSRLDPLPNVVFDALDRGCRIIQFEGATGFGDSLYRDSGAFVTVDYANPQAAASAILDLPRKLPAASYEPAPKAPVFDKIRQALRRRLESQRYFVRGASQIDVPILFSTEETDRDFRFREREKMLRYRRRLVWRDLDEVKTELAQSDNWIHRNVRLTPYVTTEPAKVPRFSMHIHAFYTDQLHEDLKRYRAYHLANRIVVTTDTGTKADDIRKIMAKEGLTPEVLLVPNRGRDILPFMELFHADGAAGDDDIWCHLHQKKSLGTTSSGDVWRTFLMRILLGNETELSGALTAIGQKRVGFVAPFDPYHIPWNGARALLPKFARVLPGPMPDNPLLFPVGNMFWVRRSVVLAMNHVFGSTYPWPNEPIANDGTEFHLIERLWPAMTTHLGLESLFMHKLDEKRV